MNDWLTLPLRLAAVAMLGVCLWIVLSSTSARVSTAFNDGSPKVSPATEQPGPSFQGSVNAVESVPANPSIGLLGQAKRILPMAIVFGISFFVFYEWICYRLFVEAYRQINKLGGVARTSVKVDWLWLHYLYCSSVVELRDREIDEGQFPLLSQIPRLKTVRLMNIRMSGDEALSATKELAACLELNCLELHNTDLSAIDLGQAGILETVPKVVLN